jgi:hypothetical protein
MTCGLPGRYDSTGILTALRNDDEQHVTLSHTDYPHPLFALFGFEVYILEPIGIFQSRNGIDKVDAMFAIVQGGFGVVPFVLHSRAYYRISVVGANFGFLGIDRREKPFCLRLPNFGLRSPHERKRHAGWLAPPRIALRSMRAALAYQRDREGPKRPFMTHFRLSIDLRMPNA